MVAISFVAIVVVVTLLTSVPSSENADGQIDKISINNEMLMFHPLNSLLCHLIPGIQSEPCLDMCAVYL